MFDLVRNNKKITQGFLALITLPFALWGVDAYFKDAGSQAEAAKVGDSVITQRELAEAMREQQDRMRQSLGPAFNPALLETREARQAILDDLISQRLLRQEVRNLRLLPNDEVLRDVIASLPAFQVDGRFSPQRYEQVLKEQGMTPGSFESALRGDLSFQHIITAIGQGAFASDGMVRRWLSVQMEEREVADKTFPAAQFLSQVKLEPTAAQAFYDANQKRFELPEQVRIEYVVLDPEAVRAQVALKDDELRAWYAANTERFQQPEERRASHILILADKDAPQAEQDKARARADEVLAKLKAAPGDFARLAKDYSQDPGSAAKGGDLGFFGRGAMVKPFEEAVFGLKEGETSGLVRSDFGWHIIRVTGIKGGKHKSFEEARAEVVAALTTERMQKKLAEQSEAFSNTVYEQSDSLQPAAEKFHLTVRTSDWLTREGSTGVLANERLRQAVFSDDAIKNHRNTEAIDVGNNTLVAARVVEHKPATVQAFAQVRERIEKQLVQEEALKLATRAGEDLLARLAKGESVDGWNPARKVRRQQAASMAPDVARAVFSTAVDKLPAHAGANIPGMGYVVFRIEAVKRPTEFTADELKAARQQYTQLIAQEDFRSYLAGLKARTKVRTNPAVLEGSKP